MMRHFLLAAAVIFVLGGCGIIAGNRISDLPPDQLQKISVTELCHPWASGPTIEAERKRRGLSDCSQEDKSCVLQGYKSGTKDYKDCRYGTPEQQALAAQQQARAAQQQFLWRCANAVATYCDTGGVLGASMARSMVSYCQQNGYYVPPQALQCAPQQSQMLPHMEMPKQTNCYPNGSGFSCTTQ